MDVKNRLDVVIDTNALSDEGDGVIRFKNGLVLTDESEQHNGTRYDVKSLDISEYRGALFADHGDGFNGYTIEKKIGNLYGVRKVNGKKGKKIVADGIKYAVNSNPLAVYAYLGTLEGNLTDFSIGTRGPAPDEEGVYNGHSLFEVSQVGMGNNKNAHVNLAINSVKQAKEYGLDTAEFERAFHVETEIEVNNTISKETDMFVTIKNSRDFAVTVSYKNAAGDDVSTELAPTASVDVAEEQKEAVENQIKNAAAPTPDITDVVNTAMKPLLDQIEEMKKNAFDKDVKEPTFTHNRLGRDAKNELSAMDWQERTVEQIENARVMLKSKGANQDAAKRLHAINEFNLDKLKEGGVVRNAMTIESFDNFVISPEQLSEIEGCRNDYTPLVDAVTFRETLSTQMTWLKRSGDITMSSVEFCDDEDDGNRKPISNYGAVIQTSNLEEMAAVTPVCNAATRFLAVDMLGDISEGYRNAYDRARAQLVVGRLQQAVDANGNVIPYAGANDVDALNAYIKTWAEVATCTPNGTFVLSNRSYAELLERALGAGVNGPLAQLFTTGNQTALFGRPFILVSDDLLPTLGTAETRTFQIGNTNVVVDNAVFYFQPSNFAGRISGGLQYDLSTDAAYEVVDGETVTVRSAFQRNELVLRGSFFRGGAIKDEDQVAAIATGVFS